jgi:hypothetical protein
MSGLLFRLVVVAAAKPQELLKRFRGLRERDVDRPLVGVGPWLLELRNRRDAINGHPSNPRGSS